MIPGHKKPQAAAHCEFCFAYHSDPRYRALIDGAATAATSQAPPRCVHRGDEISTARLVELGLVPVKQHFACGAGHGLNGIVCVCRECNPSCVDFDQASDDVVD